MADVDININAQASKARAEIKRLGYEFLGLDKAAAALRKNLGAVVAVGIGSAFVAGAVKSVNATRKLGDELQKLSVRTGETVEDLSRLQLVAGLSDVEFGRLAQTAASFARRTGEALRSPTSATATAFQQLGLEVQKSDGTLLTFQEALIQVAQRMEGMEDPTRRLQVAIDIFGRSGAELLPVLDAGAEGIREMMQEADELGVTMSTKTAEDSARLNDALAKLSGMVGGLGRRIGEYLIPTLADLADAAVRTAKKIRGTVIVFDKDGLRIEEAGYRDREKLLEKIQKKAEEIEKYKAEVIATGYETSIGGGYDPEADPFLQSLIAQNNALREQAGLMPQKAGPGVPNLPTIEDLERDLGLAPTREDPGLGDEGGAGRIARAASAAADPLAALRRELDTLGLTAEQLLAKRVTESLETLREGLDEGELRVEDYNARVSEILAQAREQRREDHEETIEQIHEESAAREEAAEGRMEFGRAVADTLQGLESLVTTFASKEGDARTAEQKKQAKAGFAAQQALATAMALVNTYLAITNALSTVQPYPAAIAASIAAGVQGFAQVAAITATSIQGVADAGLMPGALRAAGLNQHTVLAVRNDEAVVDPRGTAALSDMLELSRDSMARDMAGRGGGPQNITLELDGQVLGSITRGYRIADAERGLGFEREVR